MSFRQLFAKLLDVYSLPPTPSPAPRSQHCSNRLGPVRLSMVVVIGIGDNRSLVLNLKYMTLRDNLWPYDPMVCPFELAGLPESTRAKLALSVVRLSPAGLLSRVK